MHRPSPATVISVIALVFAMSGTAVAATGGDFILGKANTASAVSSLTNTKGTALSLSAKSTSPPLTVSNSVQVPKLNASELGGTPASGFLGVNGTAANASELGGTSASGFMHGGGTISDGRLSLLPGADEQLVAAPGNAIVAYCATAGDSLYLFGEQQAANELATWWNPGGVGQATINDSTNAIDLDGTIPTTAVIVVQIDTGSSIDTYTVTESFNSSAGSCSFTGQVTTSNG
jgi:hypothetical protein